MSSPTLPTRSIPVHAGTGTAGDRDRAERMRHVWSNIRNRLSLGFGQPPNRRHPAEASADVPPAAEGGGETAPLTDARSTDAFSTSYIGVARSARNERDTRELSSVELVQHQSLEGICNH